MSITTVKDALNNANPVDLPSRLHQIYDRSNNLGFGDVLDAVARPRGARTRSGLTNAAEQVHDVSAWIMDVYVTAGTPLAKIYGAAPGAGEVRIDYNAVTGIPTFTFAAATTEYSVVEMGPFPQTIAGIMATRI